MAALNEIEVLILSFSATRSKEFLLRPHEFAEYALACPYSSLHLPFQKTYKITRGQRTGYWLNRVDRIADNYSAKRCKWV